MAPIGSAFSKNLGRAPISRLVREAQKRNALKVLKTLSLDHLAHQRPQLAVYAYDLIGHRVNLDGVYEGESLDLLFEWLAPLREELAVSCAVDIGANIGNHSLYFARRFRIVHSFEPNPHTFRLLELNSTLASNVVCHNVGISDSDRVRSWMHTSTIPAFPASPRLAGSTTCRFA